MNLSQRIATLSLAALLGGCGFAARGFHYQGSPTLAPREANCALEIFTSRPKTKLEELGVVKFNRRTLGRLPRTEEEARDGATTYACWAGGNALLVAPNKAGVYTQAVILRVEKNPAP